MGLHALLSQRVQRRVQVVLGLVRFRVPLVHPHQVRLPSVLLLHQLQLEELELHLLHLRRLRRVTFLLRLEEMLHERQASHLEVLVLELRLVVLLLALTLEQPPLFLTCIHLLHKGLNLRGRENLYADSTLSICNFRGSEFARNRHTLFCDTLVWRSPQ